MCLSKFPENLSQRNSGTEFRAFCLQSMCCNIQLLKIVCSFSDISGKVRTSGNAQVPQYLWRENSTFSSRTHKLRLCVRGDVGGEGIPPATGILHGAKVEKRIGLLIAPNYALSPSAAAARMPIAVT